MDGKSWAAIILVVIILGLNMPIAHGLTVAPGTRFKLSTRATITLGLALNTTSLVVTSVSVEIGGVNLTITPSNGTLTATLMVWNPPASQGAIFALNATHSDPSANVTFAIAPLRASTRYSWLVDGAAKQGIISDANGKVSVWWNSWSSHVLVLQVAGEGCCGPIIPFFPFLSVITLFLILSVILILALVLWAVRRKRRKEREWAPGRGKET